MTEPQDVGKILKAEREKRALSLDVVHEATKIPMDSLRAIEEGYKIRTLTAFYYKSFVKIYALHLGLNAAELVAMIPTSQPKKKVESYAPAVKAVQTTPWQKQPKNAVPAKVEQTRQLNLFARAEGHKDVVQALPKVVVGIVALVVIFFVVGFVVSKARQHSAASSAMDRTAGRTAPKQVVKPKVEAVKKAEPARAEAVKAASVSSEVSKKVEPKAAPVAVTPKPQAQEPQAMASQVRKATLVVRASVTVFLKAKADGVVVFQGNLKKGNSETWVANKKIELSGKGIDQLEYEANGKSLGKISRRDAKIKRVVVTPEGLTAE